MTQPMDRDELARHLYISTPDPLGPDPMPQWEQNELARRWDNGGAVPGYAADCYARADQLLTEGVSR